MSARIALVAASCCLLAIALAGCGRRAQRSAAAVADSARTAPAPGMAGGAAGRGPDLALAEARDRLEPWVALWRRELAGFTLDSLSRGPAVHFQPAYSRPWSRSAAPDPNADGEDDRRGLQVWRPDSSGMVDPNLYRSVDEGGGIGYDADTAPAVWMRGRDSLDVLVVCGPSLRHDDAVWLGPARFALMGNEERGEGGEGARRFAPVIWEYDLGDTTVTTFWGGTIDEAAFFRWSSAWDSLMAERVRRARAGTP